MAGAPHLSAKDIETAITLLDGWSSKLTWELFLRILAMELGNGHVYSKVAMLKHMPIKVAWNQAKRRLTQEADAVGEKSYGTTAVASLRRMLDDARVDLKEERMKNNDLIEQFIRWQYNAERHGMKLSQLDAPLSKPRK